MKKAISLVLAAALALVSVPVGAQGFGPDTVWGTAPAGASSAANAALLDTTGKTLATAPVVDGKFAFRNVAAGQYTVLLLTATGQEIARSLPVVILSGAEVEALFGTDRVAAVVPPAAGGGLGTTAWILIGAAAIGITTAIVIATNDDEPDVASPSR